MANKGPRPSRQTAGSFSLRPKRAALFMVCPGRSSKRIWRTVSSRWNGCTMQLWRLPVAKILIVDDSAMSRRILRSILEGAGHTVTEAEDGMIALEKYYLEKPDVVLLDLIMKGMLGLKVLKKIRLMDEDARIIVATADIQTSTKAMTEAEGA